MFHMKDYFRLHSDEGVSEGLTEEDGLDLATMPVILSRAPPSLQIASPWPHAAPGF